MQNRYTGDVGDFGKYGLLRTLVQPDPPDDGHTFRLGVVWMLVPDESSRGDGQHTEYLVPTDDNLRRFLDCNPWLYAKLGWIVASRERTVTAIERYAVLPKGTRYYREPLTFQGMPAIGAAALAQRTEHRERWLRGALAATAGADVVFLDPDNGIERTIPRHASKGPKYVFIDEMEPFLKRNQSLIVYQHLGMDAAAEEQVRRRLSDVRRRLQPLVDPFALLYRRGTLRAFIILATTDHVPVLRHRAAAFLRGPWGQHFRILNMVSDG